MLDIILTEPRILRAPLWERIRKFATSLYEAVSRGGNPDRQTVRNRENLFYHLISRSEETIRRISFAYAKNKEDFEDLRQEILLNIWRGLPKFKGEAMESTWVYRVALNTCVSHMRKRYRRIETTESDLALIHAVADTSEDPAMSERLEILHRAIDSLGPTDKALITLQLEERSYEEIAEIMGMNRNTVATRLRRLKQRLLQFMNKEL